MQRPSQTELAVLGVLSVEPMTGYAIREAIRDVLGHFWSESFGQIYPTLARLEAAGLVQQQARGSDYVISSAGRRELVRLLESPFAAPPPRNPLLLRLFFGRQIGAAACIGLLETQRDSLVASIEAYRLIGETALRQQEYSADLPFWELTLDWGVAAAEAQLDWLDRSLDRLRSLPEVGPRDAEVGQQAAQKRQ